MPRVLFRWRLAAAGKGKADRRRESMALEMKKGLVLVASPPNAVQN